MFNLFYTPNSKEPDCHNGYHNFGLVSARSNHPGGVQTSLVDGSVRFVGETVDTFRRRDRGRTVDRR